MRRRSITTILIITAACVCATLAASSSSAQSGGPYAITNSTIDAGGGDSASGNLVMRGTIGQADATATLSNGALRIRGGFWAATGQPLPNDPLFSNGFE